MDGGHGVQVRKAWSGIAPGKRKRLGFLYSQQKKNLASKLLVQEYAEGENESNVAGLASTCMRGAGGKS